MSRCPALSATGPDGIAAALRAVDCSAGEATAHAFARLFGVDGALGAALTLLLTLYVALLAVNLLTGRSTLSLAMLTPRALGLGLVLTFATSWVAYQAVVWNLAVGAPDQLASLLLGTRGSATALFADRLDALFTAIADAAQTMQQGADAAKPAHGLQPADLLWLGALMLLLGTVGVLIVTKIALAALLALGPVFILLALFPGTRGLFEGWLKGVVRLAVTPLLAVLIGGGTLAAIAPIVAGLGGGEVTMRAAVTVFLAASVHGGLMAMALKLAATLTAGWRIDFGNRATTRVSTGSVGMPVPAAGGGGPLSTLAPSPPHAHAAIDRLRTMVAPRVEGNTPTPAPGEARTRVIRLDSTVATPAAPPRSGSDGRAQGIGRRFRPAAAFSSRGERG